MKYVLVVDDDKRWQDLIIEWLKEEDYTPVRASSLEDAINALNKNRIDMAIVDINLAAGRPDNRDGEKFVAHLKKKYSKDTKIHIPIIIVSGTIPADSTSLDGVFDFLPKKDLEGDEFLDKVAQAILSE